MTPPTIQGRLFELDHGGDRSGMLCAVVEDDSMKEFGAAGRSLTERLRADRLFEAICSGIYARRWRCSKRAGWQHVVALRRGG